MIDILGYNISFIPWLALMQTDSTPLERLESLTKVCTLIGFSSLSMVTSLVQYIISMHG